MARLGRLFDSLKKPNGEAAIGVSIEVRRQGATITSGTSGTSPLAITVDDPGGIRAGDTVRLGTGSTDYNVDSIAATGVTISGFGGTLVVNAGTRITPTNNKPTLYSDRQGVNVLASLLTGSPFGEYEAYLDGGEYDLLASGGGYGTRLFKDVYVSSPRMVFNTFDNATAKAVILAVKNALANASAKLLSIQNPDGVEKVFIDKDGNVFVAGGIGTTQLADNAVTAAKLASDAVTTVKILDANVTTAKLAANAVHPAPSKTLAGSSDVTITTAEVVRATTSYTPVSGNVGLLITINLPYAVTTGGTGKAEARLYIGGTLKAVGVYGAPTTAGIGTISFTWFEPTAAAAPTTIEVREIKTSFNGGTTAVIAYYGASGYQGYMTLQEMKK